LGVGQGSAVEVELDEETTLTTTLPEETATMTSNTTEEPNTTKKSQTTPGDYDSDGDADAKGAPDQEDDDDDDGDETDGEDETEEVDDTEEGDQSEDGDEERSGDDEKPKLQPIPFPPRPRAFDKVVDSISDFADRVKSGRSRHGKMTDVDAEEDANQDAQEDIAAASPTLPSESDDPPNLSPVFETQPSMIQFFAPGEPFALVCSAAPGSEVKYSWTRNGRPMNMEDAAARRIFRENAAANGNLIFVSPGTGDVGTYTCLAENEHGKTYSTGSVVMVRRKKAELGGDSGETTEEIPEMEVETGDDNEVVLAEGEREPRREGVFLVYPAVADEADAQIVEDAGAGGSDSSDE